jgi:PST family polysaccharide transporter
MIVPGRFDCRGFDFNKFRAQAELISVSLGFIIVATGHARLYMFTEASAVVVFILVSWLLLPVMGIEATGIGFFAMYLFYSPLVFWFAYRRTGFRWTSTVLRSLAMLFIFAVIAAAGHWQDWLGATVGLVAAFAFGVMSLLRLARMAELGGHLGKLAGVARRILKPTGTIHD